MRYLTMLVTMVLAMLVMVGQAWAQEMRPLSINEQAAHGGATHRLVVKHSDLDTAATNTAETLTFAVLAGQAVEMVYFRLVEAFDTANTNFTGSLSLTIGDGTDADLYLTATEIASDGTEILAKWPPTVYVAASVTNAVPTVSYLGRKVYTADDTVDIVLTPNSEEATSANTSGEFEAFFKILN